MNLQNYKCLACGYSASSQTTTDQKGHTALTFHCLGCKSLVLDSEIKGQNLETINQAEANQHIACPRCESLNIKLWDYKHPCPRCGEHMTKPFSLMI